MLLILLAVIFLVISKVSKFFFINQSPTTKGISANSGNNAISKISAKLFEYDTNEEEII